MKTQLRPSVHAAVVALTLTLASCGGGGGSVDPTSTSGDESTTPAATTPTATTPAATDDPGSPSPSQASPATAAATTELTGTIAPSAVSERAAALDLPRAMTYAGVEMTVQDAIFSTATPDSYGTAQPFVSDSEHLYLTLNVAYIDGYPGSGGFLQASNISIVTPDGTEIGAQGVQFQAEIPVSTAADTQAVLAFPVTEEQLEGATLVYDDGEHEPARLPLTGAVPTPVYPIRTDVGEVVTVTFPTGCDPAPGELELVALEWDVDAGVEPDGTKLVEGDTSRTLAGQRFVRAEVKVEAIEGQCGGTFANAEQFRISVDGDQSPPVNEPSETLDDGETVDLTFGFAVPVDAQEVALIAGHPDGTTHTFPVTIPDELP